MISEVFEDRATYNDVPARFEAGTMNIAEEIGLAAAIDYIGSVGGMAAIRAHEMENSPAMPSPGSRMRERRSSVRLTRPCAPARSRSPGIGGRALVDVHIIVEEDISVSEGHYISEMVRTRLVEEVNVVADALVHIDPEDDVHSAPARALPSRSAVQARLKEAFRDIPAAAGIERVVLHDVGGRLRVEVVCRSRQ